MQPPCHAWRSGPGDPGGVSVLTPGEGVASQRIDTSALLAASGMRVAFDPGMDRLLLVNGPALRDHALGRVLSSNGYAVTGLTSGDALLEEVVSAHAGAIIYVLPAASAHDLALLRLMRRAAPSLPLVLLAAEGSLEVQREALQLRPVYYGVAPVDEEELLGAVRAAIDGPRKRANGTAKVRRPAGSA